MRRALTVASFALATLFANVAFGDDTACVDANEKSISLRRAGKLRDALKQVAVCGAPGCPHEIADECARRARTINDAIPTLILSATDGTGADIANAKVTIDGAPFADKLDGQPITLDPGPHTIRLENGAIRSEKTLVLRENEKARRENFVLAPPAAPKPIAPPPPPPPVDQGLGPQRTAAIVTGGVGTGSLVLGVVTGLMANSKKSSEEDACSASSCPDYKAAKNDYDSAHTLATVSTIGFIAAGVLVAAGTVLWLTAPKSSSTTGSLGTWTF